MCCSSPSGTTCVAGPEIAFGGSNAWGGPAGTEFVTPGAVYPGGIARAFRSGPITDDEQPTPTTIIQIVDALNVKANGVGELNLFRDSRIDRILTVFLGPDSALAYSRACRAGQVNFATILDGKPLLT